MVRMHGAQEAIRGLDSGMARQCPTEYLTSAGTCGFPSQGMFASKHSTALGALNNSVYFGPGGTWPHATYSLDRLQGNGSVDPVTRARLQAYRIFFSSLVADNVLPGVYAYSPEEMQALDDWVRQDGGILVAKCYSYAFDDVCTHFNQGPDRYDVSWGSEWGNAVTTGGTYSVVSTTFDPGTLQQGTPGDSLCTREPRHLACLLVARGPFPVPSAMRITFKAGGFFEFIGTEQPVFVRGRRGLAAISTVVPHGKGWVWMWSTNGAWHNDYMDQGFAAANLPLWLNLWAALYTPPAQSTGTTGTTGISTGTTGSTGTSGTSGSTGTTGTWTTGLDTSSIVSFSASSSMDTQEDSVRSSDRQDGMSSSSSGSDEWVMWVLVSIIGIMGIVMVLAGVAYARMWRRMRKQLEPIGDDVVVLGDIDPPPEGESTEYKAWE